MDPQTYGYIIGIAHGITITCLLAALIININTLITMRRTARLRRETAEIERQNRETAARIHYHYGLGGSVVASKLEHR